MTSPNPPIGTEAVALHIAPPLAIVRLQDHAARNRMSPAMQVGLISVLDTATRNADVKVVVIEGMPDVFCAGHTVGALLGNEQERRVAQGWDFVRASTQCPLPVVAAVQGHAIGTGLLHALYADVAVLSEQSSYAINALTYGLTPCFGATYILPAKMGAALGAEMLYSGRTYRGRELADRGAGILVVAHDSVPIRARHIARRIAQAPRRSLELLKIQLTAASRVVAEAAQRLEAPDHLSTIADEEVRRRIELLHPEHHFA